MRSFAVLIALAVASVSATVPSYNSSLDMKIDPNEVDQQLRAGWCQAQTNSCQQLCDNNADENNCEQATLEFSCLCSSNHSAPAEQYYIQTMPTFICQRVFSDCISANAGDAKGQADCKTHIEKLCGTATPPAPGSGTTTSAASSKTSSSSATTATADATAIQTAATSQTKVGFAAPTLGPAAGTGAVAVAAAGLFALLL